MRRNAFITTSILSVLIASCSAFKRDEGPKSTQLLSEGLKAKRDLYLSLQKQNAVDADGFIFNARCDGLLFAALNAVGGGSVNIHAAEGEEGRWYRTPSKDCFDSGASASDISNDMLLGLAIWAWSTKNLKVVSDVLEYGKRHSFVMGRGDKFRTLMRPTLLATFKNIQRRLKGEPVDPVSDTEISLGLTSKDDTQLIAATLPSGYEAHLQVLHGLLRASVLGGTSDAFIKIVRSHVERQPDNALFQAAFHLYTDGNQTAATEILMNEKWFPADRLPAQSDRCVPNLFEHDMDEGNLSSCSKYEHSHGGEDLLFVVRLIERGL